MNAKKAEDVEIKKNVFKSCFIFFGELKQELKKISWTNKKELKNFTKMVLISTFSVGLSIYLIDMVIQKSLTLIHILTQRIFG